MTGEVVLFLFQALRRLQRGFGVAKHLEETVAHGTDLGVVLGIEGDLRKKKKNSSVDCGQKDLHLVDSGMSLWTSGWFDIDTGHHFAFLPRPIDQRVFRASALREQILRVRGEEQGDDLIGLDQLGLQSLASFARMKVVDRHLRTIVDPFGNGDHSPVGTDRDRRQR